jgi:hypothetical protein
VKTLGGIFLKKVYSIYIKDECVYANLPEKMFQDTWGQLTGMVGIMKTEYTESDLTYKCKVIG